MCLEPELKAIIFCAALDEFDRAADEDENMTGYEEAIKIFEKVVQFVQEDEHPKALFLFLNKSDIFKTKLGKFQRCFPDYKGTNTSTSIFFFLILHQKRGKEI